MEEVLENTTLHQKPFDDSNKTIEDLDDFIFSEYTGKIVSER